MFPAWQCVLIGRAAAVMGPQWDQVRTSHAGGHAVLRYYGT